MAEDKDEVGGAKKAGEEALDPIVDRSMSFHFFISTLLLFATIVWATADEFWLRRPYGGYQREFRSLAIEKTEFERKQAEEELKKQQASTDFKQAQAQLEAARAKYDSPEAKAEREKLQARFTELIGLLNEERGKFQVARGDYQPLVYNLDHAKLEGHPDEAQKLETRIKELEPNIQAIFLKMDALGREKKTIQAQLDDLAAPVGEAQRNLEAKVPAARKLADAELKAGGLKEMRSGVLDEYQIYSPSLGLVDRCKSCHIAIDKPGYGEAEWEAAKSVFKPEQIELAKMVYATHPNLLSGDPGKFDWLAVHNIAKFGCTSCHWGNGPATASPEKAHGAEGEATKSWTKPMEFQLTPLLPVGSLEACAKNEQHFGNMMEATCSKCHLNEVNLTGAPQLSYGRQIIEDLGCWGCHKIKGFEQKELELQGLQERLARELGPKKDELGRAFAKADEDADDAKKLELSQAMGNLNHDITVATRRTQELDKEIKFIGPDLNRKDLGGLKNKIYAPWLPRWIYNPQHFRPGTWMPNPLLHEQEAIETAAYIWQQASGNPTDSLEPTAPSDPKTIEDGRRVVEQRGCLACHTLEDQGTAPNVEPLRPTAPAGVGEKFALYDLDGFEKGKGWWADPKAHPIDTGGRADLLKKGEHFGPSLARVGEKIRYEWLIQWVKDPKSVQPHTRMPNLRLSDDEAKAVAAFLTTLRHDPPGGEKFAKLDRAKLEDPKLAERGYEHVVRYGCFNCHAIDMKGPNPGKIGAELSSHGSKPLAQFDFGFVKVPETRNVWLETKILEPRIWDTGKYKGDPNDRLRMPRFGLSGKEAAAVTTVLVGLTDQTIPGEYIYRPAPREAAIVEGERLVRKFNCRSCHIINGEGQWAKEQLTKAIVDAVPEVKAGTAEARLFLPPILNGQGHRSEPGWLFKFLKDPGLYQPLRPWHVIRMPRFDMSDTEATALVEYFSALEKERYPYEAKEVADDGKLVDEGRATFIKAQCFQCHRIGDWVPPGKQPHEQGPNFAYARERLRADWIERFIPDPQAFIPGANMPSFFNNKPFALQSPQDQRTIQSLRAYVRQLAGSEFREQESWTKNGKGPSGPR